RRPQQSDTAFPSSSVPLAVTVLTCDVPPTPVIVLEKVQFTFSPGARLIGTSKQPLPPSSSRSPNLSSTTFVMATSTSADVFVIVTEKLTGPPGSFTVVGFAVFS